MSIASELLPLPLGPQKTVIWSRGIFADTSFRLCWRAPWTVMCLASVAALSCGRVLAVAIGLPSVGGCAAWSWQHRTQAPGRCAIAGMLATSSGVPATTISPPPAPPSGPRSMIQSAVLITSRLCSTTSTVLPASTKSCSTFSSSSMSAKCKPVVGSSSRYSVLPVLFLTSSRASLMRCASPPESVGDGWPSFR